MFKRLAVVCVVAILTACSPPPSEEKPKEQVAIASEKTILENFENLSTESTGESYNEYYARKAENLEQYQELWTTFRMKEEPPNIDFTKKEAYFISFYESGSCHKEPKNVQIRESTLTFLLEKADGEEEICTDDLSPRTLVLKLDSADVNNLLIQEREAETEVPLK